jgi:hypothetical protein
MFFDFFIVHTISSLNLSGEFPRFHKRMAMSVRRELSWHFPISHCAVIHRDTENFGNNHPNLDVTRL